MDCQHSRFEVVGRVVRDEEGGHALFVRCRCAECGTPWKFKAECGWSDEAPTRDYHAEELRCPIVPAAQWVEAPVEDAREDVARTVERFIKSLPPMPAPPPTAPKKGRKP